jgi:hypothetical protein
VKPFGLVAVALALVLGGAGAVRADFIVNGDFEAVQIGPPFASNNPADIPGWVHSGSSGDALLFAVGYVDTNGSVTVAGSGRQFVVMGGGFTGTGTGNWDQVMTGLTPGQTYVLTFRMASEGPNTGPAGSGPQSLTVSFPSGSSTGPQVFTASASSANYWRNWEQKTETFVATASTVDLRFSATTQFDVGFDSVSVNAVAGAAPEPSTFVLFGLGTLGLLRFVRRGRRSVPAPAVAP